MPAVSQACHTYTCIYFHFSGYKNRNTRVATTASQACWTYLFSLIWL